MATLVERWLAQGREEGRQQERRNGLLSTIEMGLDIKFGDEGMRLYQEIQKIQEMDVLQAIRDKIKAVSSMGELRRIYQSPPSPCYWPPFTLPAQSPHALPFVKLNIVI